MVVSRGEGESRQLILTVLDRWDKENPHRYYDPGRFIQEHALTDAQVRRNLVYLADNRLIEHRYPSRGSLGDARITAFGQDILMHPERFQADPNVGPVAQVIVNTQGATFGQGQFGGMGNTISGTATVHVVNQPRDTELDDALDKFAAALVEDATLNRYQKRDASDRFAQVRAELDKPAEQQDRDGIVYYLQTLSPIVANSLQLVNLLAGIKALIGI